MKQTFLYSNTNKRYHTWNYYVKQKFHSRIYKVALQAGFSCPNRDGTCGSSGCTFCEEGSAGFAGNVKDPVWKQFMDGATIAHQKWKDVIPIPYFQAYSNTYAPLPTLKELYDPFATNPTIPMLCIATRCDCLNEENIAYLASLCEECEVWIELGLQSVFDESAQRIQRGHSYAQFEQAIRMLQKTNIKICVHIINSLPQECQQHMLTTIDTLAKLPIHAVKIHMLHIMENTILKEEYIKHPFPLQSKEEYIDTVIKQLERLPASIIIQRLTGDGDKKKLIAPLWTKDKRRILNDIDKEMVRRDTWQGKYVQQ